MAGPISVWRVGNELILNYPNVRIIQTAGPDMQSPPANRIVAKAVPPYRDPENPA